MFASNYLYCRLNKKIKKNNYKYGLYKVISDTSGI